MPPVTYDGSPVVVGAGLAGLLTAVRLAPSPVIVLSAVPLGTQTSTAWAQGGLAAAVGPDDDPQRHARDTLAAGAGLCDPGVVRAITAAGPAAVAELVDLGARLDRDDDGRLVLGLEGAHSRRRIVHAHGDGTGAELQRTALAAARALPSVTLLEGARAVRLLTDAHGVCGVLVDGPAGRRVLATRQVVLATGGIGGLYAHTTNPLGSRGQGLALAARAGATLRDVELVQFHPTALDVGLDPMPLVSEAVRGEGAIVVDETGARVIDDPLAARDVVSRAEWAALDDGHQVLLDARAALGDRFAQRFPAIAEHCRAAGLDPARDLLPVRPAAHYHMGGIAVDLAGRTTVPGLHAVGECASTGLHGANRLASNSLLEAAVCSRWVADELARAAADLPAMPALEDLTARAAALAEVPTAPDPATLTLVRHTVERSAGVLRDATGLESALDLLAPLAGHDDAALVGALLCAGALRRQESRGGHTRTDAPATAAPHHTHLTQDDVLATTTERIAS
ncbi:L-aspartate oxidase [Arsenicicoccus dermatophilus]|uniref:L-aspartate oxidase n=1 Tax=Arsenicicoccus dermatophilus TaxID=1076331 RepID=UPI001F4C586D|nr:L-aspartate oxidase [Arsenicicoccus dermatophilus]MCH8612806.1 L-aspartate oxidase [Arsenicicoccus dermatophilus]